MYFTLKLLDTLSGAPARDGFSDFAISLSSGMSYWISFANEIIGNIAKIVAVITFNGLIIWWPYMLKKMINRLIGSKEVSNQIQPLIFKDNISAFEYACQYLDTSLSPDKPMPAIIIPGPSGEQPVLLDSGRQRAMLKVCSDDGGFFVIADSSNSKGPKLKIGDFVAWLPVDYAEEIKDKFDDPRSAMVGFVLGTLEPVLTPSGWKGKERFNK